MSNTPSLGFEGRVSSRFSRFKKRLSSVFSSSPPASLRSNQPICLPENDTGKSDESTGHAENRLSPQAHYQSVSNKFDYSVAHSMSAHPSPSHLEGHTRTHPRNPSTNLASAFSPRDPQEQLSTFQGPILQGAFSHAQNFIMNNPAFIASTAHADNFLKDFLQNTIIGAGFDSSARNPPPRCHPGTRTSTIQRCLDFIGECSGPDKLRWVLGPAGVGKSAVMQFIAENVPEGVICASVFLSLDGRQDGTKVVTTIAYQLAVKDGRYHQFIRNEISLDPDLPQKSVSIQFRKFIVEPLIHHHVLHPSQRLLVLIDSLDECANVATQLELLELISDFCITYPTSPVAWIIATRPEPHITSFFSRAKAYAKEELIIDSKEAYEDVQRYLRDELDKVKLASPTLKHKPHWPSKRTFTRIAAAAGGFFAYASTVLRYISNPSRGNPVTLLTDVLAVIEGTKLRLPRGNDHPMDHLDALYARILSHTPVSVEPDTRKLLLLCLENRVWNPFRMQCNLLGLTEDAAYGAVHHTYSVVKVPRPDDADKECLKCFHNSFEDYLSDFKRSKFCRNARGKADELATQVSLRVVGEVPDDSDGMGSGEGIACDDGSCLKGDPAGAGKISLSWPCDERFQLTDDQLRLMLYRYAVADVAFRFRPGRKAFANLSCFHVLTTRFTAHGSGFRHYELQIFAFDKFRHKLAELDVLKQVPLRALDCAAIYGGVDVQFMSPADRDIGSSNSWNSTCKHEKREMDDLDLGRQGWTTTFGRSQHDMRPRQNPVDDSLTPAFNHVAGNTSESSHRHSLHDEFSSEDEQCHNCLHRLSLHIINHPDHLATAFVDSTNMCYVELLLDDVNDGVSQWRYRFCHSGTPTCIDV